MGIFKEFSFTFATSRRLVWTVKEINFGEDPHCDRVKQSQQVKIHPGASFSDHFGLKLRKLIDRCILTLIGTVSLLAEPQWILQVYSVFPQMKSGNFLTLFVQKIMKKYRSGLGPGKVGCVNDDSFDNCLCWTDFAESLDFIKLSWDIHLHGWATITSLYQSRNQSQDVKGQNENLFVGLTLAVIQNRIIKIYQVRFTIVRLIRYYWILLN